MRLDGLTVACIAAVAGLGCTEKLLLPRGGFDAGTSGGGQAGSINQGGNGGAGQGGRGGPGNGGSRGGSFCNERLQSVKLPIQRTRLLFSIGKNSSMTNRSFGNNGGTRLSVVEQIVRSVVLNNRYAVNFGYQDFPGTGTCAAGMGCCSGNFTPTASTTFTAIDEALTCGPPPATKGCGTSIDARPIAAALQESIGLFDPTDGAPQVLVLIADGDPGCGAQDSGQSCFDARVARSKLASPPPSGAGAKTVVVGVGQDGQSAPCLADLGKDGGDPFFLYANDPGQLSNIINAQVNDAADAACLIRIQGSTDRSSVKVVLGAREVPRDGSDGWDFLQRPVLTIQVRGSACSELQRTPDADIQVVGCPSP